MSILSNNFIFTPPSPTVPQLESRALNSLTSGVQNSFIQIVNFQRQANNTIWYNSLSAQQVFDSFGADAPQLATYLESLSGFIRAVSTFEGISAQLVEPAHSYVVGVSSVTVGP